MRSLVLVAPLGGFGFLTYQYSFWIAMGISYFVAMSLVVLVAFSRRGQVQHR